MEKLIVPADVLAPYALKAAEYNLEVPYLWAQGQAHPFYYDDRKLMSNPEARKVLKEALPTLTGNARAIDYIYPVPNAGTGPATILAESISKPIIFKVNNRYCTIDIKEVHTLIEKNFTELQKATDVIVSTLPIGIVLGTIIAEKLNMPFLFVRERPKKYGLKQQIEGVIRYGDDALLVDPRCDGFKSYTLDAVEALRMVGITTLAEPFCPSIDYLLKEVSLENKTVVAMEGVVSTGKSSLNEILQMQNAGANVMPCSVFSYNFKSAVENFEKHGLINKSLTNFEDLMAFTRNQDDWPIADVIKLCDWHNKLKA